MDICKYIVNEDQFLAKLKTEGDQEVKRLSHLPDNSTEKLNKALEEIISFYKNELPSCIVEINSTILKLVQINIDREKSILLYDNVLFVVQMNADGSFYNEYQGNVNKKFLKENEEFFNLIIYDGRVLSGKE